MKVKVLEAFSGPGSRALPAETMRQLPFPGPVGPTGLASPRRFTILVGATGGRPMGPSHPAETGLSLPEKGSPGRCFLRATPLTPGHGKGYRQSEGGQAKFLSPSASYCCWVKIFTLPSNPRPRQRLKIKNAGGLNFSVIPPPRNPDWTGREFLQGKGCLKGT